MCDASSLTPVTGHCRVPGAAAHTAPGNTADEVGLHGHVTSSLNKTSILFFYHVPEAKVDYFLYPVTSMYSTSKIIDYLRLPELQ